MNQELPDHLSPLPDGKWVDVTSKIAKNLKHGLCIVVKVEPNYVLRLTRHGNGLRMQFLHGSSEEAKRRRSVQLSLRADDLTVDMENPTLREGERIRIAFAGGCTEYRVASVEMMDL